LSSRATSSSPSAGPGVPKAVRSLARVLVGSGNAAKIQAVRDGLAAFVPRLEVDGVEVESGVPDQPVGFDEILRGARNRARAALDTGACDLAAGIEDGLVTLPGVEDVAGRAAATLNLGCAWLTDGRRESFGLSSGFGYPDACAQTALRERAPIGDLFDELWRAREPAATAAGASGAGVGNIGKLTLGVVERAEYGRHAVVCAFVRYLHPDLYPGCESPGAETPGVGGADTRVGGAGTRDTRVRA
jgi:inosine/xanthosine triphosphatase